MQKDTFIFSLLFGGMVYCRTDGSGFGDDPYLLHFAGLCWWFRFTDSGTLFEIPTSLLLLSNPFNTYFADSELYFCFTNRSLKANVYESNGYIQDVGASAPFELFAAAIR